jgi:hypothetical protein
MADARFEDGIERPLRLLAMDGEGLEIISALTQDAVISGNDLAWDRKRRQFGLLLNRFRWEDRDAAERAGRAFERVRSALVFDHVLAVQRKGVQPGAGEAVLALLSISFAHDAQGAGWLTLVLAGGGAIRLEVEALEASLRDVSRPHRAVSGRAPDHDQTPS